MQLRPRQMTHVSDNSVSADRKPGTFERLPNAVSKAEAMGTVINGGIGDVRSANNGTTGGRAMICTDKKKTFLACAKGCNIDIDKAMLSLQNTELLRTMLLKVMIICNKMEI